MRLRKTSWRKRILAVILAASMLVTMTPTALAEDDLNQPVSDASEIPEEETGTNMETVSSKENITDDSNTDVFADDVEEPGEDTKIENDASVEKAGSGNLMEDSSELGLRLNLLAGEDSGDTQTMISLSQALSIEKEDSNPPISRDANNLNVNGAKGLILLSNIKPEEYKSLNINLKNIANSGWDVTTEQKFTIDENNKESYSFHGLGNAKNPYAGIMAIAEGSEGYSITAKQALFNAISTDASLPSNINFMMAGNKSGQIVLADQVIKGTTDNKTLKCKVILTIGTSQGAATSDTIGGILGTLGENAKASVTLTNSLTDTLTVSGGNNRGLFCNTMASGSSLTANLTNSDNATITVTATSGDAGGYVGHMDGNNTLTISGKAVNTVTSDKGNAGGLVGSATDAAINVTNGTFDLSDVTITATNGNAGSIVGDYTNTNTITTDDTLNLAQFTLDTTLSGGTNAGGVFGTLTNSGSYTITGGQNAITSQLKATSTNYGGVIGQYKGNALTTTLTIRSMSITSNSASKNPFNYGGVIGNIPNSAYVELHDLTDVKTQSNAQTNIGGLVADMGSSEGVMLNIGSVNLTRNSNDNLKANGTIGGLVGYLEQGVVRLYGTTNLSGMTIKSSGGGTGQIVGKNGYANGKSDSSKEKCGGIVYAVGTGNDDGTTGWKLIRNGTTAVSDIGNWGEVVRLDGTELKETTTEGDTAASNLFYFNKTEHTVTILGEPKNVYSITSVRNFAAYALAFDFAGRVPSNVLKGIESVTSTSNQTINIGADIDLTGTGIFGIGRDNGANVNNNYFSGTLDGEGHKVILDIGSSYGFASDGTAQAAGIGSGLVYVHQSGWMDSGHGYLGLIATATTDAKVRNLTLEGSIQATLLGTNSGTRTRAAAAVAYMDKDNLELSNVKVQTDLTLNAKDKNTDSSDVALATFVGDINKGVSVKFDGCTWDKESTVSTDYYAINSSNRRCDIGVLLALAQKSNIITVKNCVLSGEIVANGDVRNDARVGGLVAEVNNDNNTTSRITISDLTVVGERITTTASVTCGGLLGYSWNKTNVTFAADTGSTGVTISNCNLNANNAKFGGLVYQATGYWNATTANSIHFEGTNTIIKGKSDKDNTSGLLVGTGIDNSDSNNIKAFYLEVGTWGNATDAAYTIDGGSVTLTNTLEYFDELVGKTINTDKGGNAGHDNAVVSLATPDHAPIDNTVCNTYTGQLGTNFKNGNTRYYYNLDSNRSPNSVTGLSDLSAGGLDSASKVLSWSVSQYAAENIRGYFCSKNNNTYNTTISAAGSDDINLTGYSYYPVSPLGTVTVGLDGTTTTLTFAYEEMNVKENDNKMFNDNTHQHYLMHHGLLYNTGSNVTVTGTTFKGTVGKKLKPNNTFDSGALIFGNISGDTTKSPATVPTVQLKNVTLAGLKVSDAQRANYAPLLINTIGAAVTLMVDDLTTGAGYVDENNNTAYAATSLIGRVGSSSATKLTLTFSKIALDSRKEGTGSGTSVNNNGNASYKVEYNTYHTIFTRATLLEFFQYSSDSSGVYNFNSDDTKVTYGVEISNTGTTGRNPGGQYQYYNNEDYVWDGTETKPATDTAIGDFYTEAKYLRYVHQSEPTENNTNNYHELDINLRTAHLDAGCGTYGHPYQITNGKQLTALADYLVNGRANKWVVCVNGTVLTNGKQDSSSYHTGTSDNDQYYMCDGEKWYNATKGTDGKFAEGTEATDITVAKMRTYLRNAYYQIQNDIFISGSTYMGIGGSVTSGDTANAFSGVIVGKDIGTAEARAYPTVYISSTIPSAANFGGLVRYSQGSVIKNLTVSYAGGKITENGQEKTVDSANITMNNTAVPSSSNNPFFGGVVGYCMGGDTIIDNVSVNYGENSVTLSSENDQKPRLIAAGGYVGLVGGAKDSNGYEKTGGGVVFRNMDEKTTNPFAGSMATNSGKDSTYFYCNPYVGRVLDGYACYDNPSGTAGQFTLNNTDKNYTIPDLVTDASGLVVETNTENSVTTYNVTVSSAQGLWLLSAIVNSGAGAMDGNGTYQDYDSDNNNNNRYVEAYQYGKVRSGAYDKIGTPEGASDLADEAYWGGVACQTDTDDAKAKARARVSYLVKNFTSDTNAAHLTGRSNTNSTKSANNPVSLTFSPGEINMSPYKNGFRGIGGSFGDKKSGKDIDINNVFRRTLRVKKVSGDGMGSTITLVMEQHDYQEEYDARYWTNQGAGLFTVLSYEATTSVPDTTTKVCPIENLTISGKVGALTYSAEDGSEQGVGKQTYDVGVGGFASRTGNSADQKLAFNNFNLKDLNVTGGTSTGGVIGLNERAGAIEFNKWSIINTEVYKWVTNDGSTGGFVGWHHSGKSFIINGYGSPSEQGSDRQWNIQNLSVTVQADERKYGNIGGLTGANDDSEVSITDVNIKGMTVTGIAARDVGGLADGGNNKITVKDCWLEDIKVSGETNNNKKSSGSVGGLLGFSNNKDTTIENVTITGNSSVKSSDSHVGGLIGEARSATAVMDCHITGSSGKPILVCNSASSYAGGLIGKSSNNITISDCTETYLNILANGSDAAGLIGKMEGNKVAAKASNVVFSNVIVAVKAQGKSIGLLTGYIDSSSNVRKIYGYNILADSCKLGWNNSDGISIGTLADAELNTTGNTGLWLGGIKTQDHKLVAVAVKGTNQPQKDVGNIVSGTVNITYADYPVDQGNTPTTGSASPWLDVNPKIEIGGLTLTGNGVGYMTGSNTTLGNSIAHTILTEAVVTEEEAQGGASQRTYWKVKDASKTDKTFSKFLSDSNDVYLTTYQTEEKGTGTTSNTTVPSTTDFPILVVNGLADADKEIWNYIAALTNVESGDKAKGQAESVTSATYVWTANSGAEKAEDGTVEGSFVKKNGEASLTVLKDTTTDKNTTISITENAYDNQQSRFTLLDVKYDDPTDGNSNGFHLYVPVLVKKVLYTSFSAKFLAGTNYLKNNYMNFKSDTFATAGFDEPVTAYIEYNYDRTKDDWEKMLQNGENLLWNYNKELDLASGNSVIENKSVFLPDGTRLTLVDKQTKKCYIHTFINKTDATDVNGDNVHAFNLSKMTLDGTTKTEAFNPVPICDLLGLTIDETPDSTKTQYVRLDGVTAKGTVPEGATVKVGDIYYRKAEDDDTGDKYTISVGNVFDLDTTAGTSYLEQGEGYYLTIQIPKEKADKVNNVVNNTLDVYSKTMKGIGSNSAAPLASIKDSIASGYVIYDGVKQSSLTISTSRNGNTDLDTKMKDGDSIKVTLSSTLSLTDAGKKYFSYYTPNELAHQFSLSMKKQLGTVNEDTVIGATRASYTYTVKQSDGTVLYDDDNNKEIPTVVISGSETLNELPMKCSSTVAREMARYLRDSTSGTLTITAEITLPYPTLGTYFPARSGDGSSDGIFVSAVSRVANVSSQLTITTNKETKDGTERYYTENASNASLNYHTVNGGADNDITQQLGINPSDEVNNSNNVIYTQADYDYSGVDSVKLASATQIQYTMELFRKGTDGKYDGDALSVTSYLKDVNISNPSDTSSSLVWSDNFSSSLVWSDKFSSNDSHRFVDIHFTPLTGTDFETAGFTYANYKVKLTAVLLDSYNDPIQGTEASDYIIYTNARIYQKMISSSAETESNGSTG